MPNIKQYSKSKDGNIQISQNFKVKEFACKDGTDTILIDKEMIFILQKIREILGTIKINSAYRTSTYNKKVGGASNSYHCKGQAFDIIDANGNIRSICNIANTLGVKGIIKYNTFVHIDSRSIKYHALDNGTKLTFLKYNIPFKTTIKYKDKNNDVGIIQFKLNSLGYNAGIVDGICGEKTINALRDFQRNNNLMIDGICGKNTWNKLFN